MFSLNVHCFSASQHHICLWSVYHLHVISKNVQPPIFCKICFLHLNHIILHYTACQFSFIWPFCSCSSSRIELGDVTPHNIKQLKRLNQVIFPVSYNDKFYKDVLEVGELAKLGKNHHWGTYSQITLKINLLKCEFNAYPVGAQNRTEKHNYVIGNWRVQGLTTAWVSGTARKKYFAGSYWIQPYQIRLSWKHHISPTPLF